MWNNSIYRISFYPPYTQKLDNDLTMFGDKLSKTFNGITMS